MSAEWWRSADGDGYTSDITRADPWDITRKHTAREWVLSGEEPDMVAALARYNRENPRGRREMQYMGGKSQIAKAIRAHLVSHGATKYVEPFVGGGAVLTTVAKDFKFILAADAHADLIAMYQAIQDGSFTPPDTVTEEEYRALRESDPSPLRTFAAFGASFGGKEWGGYARMTTTTRNGKPRSPEDKPNQSRNSLIKSAKAGMFGDHVEFRAVSVFDLNLPGDLEGTVIYCDPPYAGTTGYRTGEFDATKAWDLYREWASRGAHVYVSEYAGPGDLVVVDELRPQARMKEASSNRVTEKLFYIPPTREENPMTKPNPFRPKVSEALAEVIQDGPPMRVTVDRSVAPNIHQLPRVEVPDHQAYYPHISAWLATGQPARDAVDQVQAGTVVAIDTETMGLGADSFTLKCLTAAWETANGTVSVLLDPTRRDDDRQAVRDLLGRAGTLVLQNAAFDVPPLHQNGLMSLADIAKVHDTVVYARMAYPDTLVNKSLESLATKLVGFPDSEVTMAQLFKSNGLTTAEGFRVFDIDKPIYRLGAMADTVATLRLLAQIQAKAWSRLAEGHPFGEYGVDSDGAVALMEREQEVNRIMLRRSARGLQVDTDYLATYEETHARELTAARDALAAEDLDPESGNLGFLLVSRLEDKGELPADWPRTDSGRLRATKDDLPKLDHPLAAAVRKVSELAKVTGYLTKVNDMVKVTGRVHPQVGILKASATGRMAYSWPELQQFPADARPIIVSDGGLTSVDWSQIEPVVMANCAQDWQFLEPFEAGGDLYAPIVEAAGVTRKVAKVLLLAAMYGQGRNSMAAALGISTEEAQRLQAGMFSAMPTTRGFIDRLRQIGEDHGLIITADGRVLPIPKANGQTLAYKAVNYFCQGSAYSVLADTIVRLERAGLGDNIHLALHDELVVDTEAAEAVAEVMRTPPEFLQRWTGGRVPVFKTDANDMGRTWLYV
ncbi:DNA polymerase I [Nocardia phage NS-I]|nr:DNA polymerase I [Nocardia phage NS-I]